MLPQMLDYIRGHLELCIEVGSILGSFFMLWWKISGKVHLAIREMECLKKASAESTKSNEEIRKVISNLARAASGLRATLVEREKDILKLEGAIESHQRTQIELIGTIKETVGNLEAIWRTLQVLHPDRVPKRASDRV